MTKIHPISVITHLYIQLLIHCIRDCDRLVVIYGLVTESSHVLTLESILTSV